MITPIQTQIRLPGKYQKQPVISRLTSRYGLTVNITAASLLSGANNEGWFNIELSGNPEKLTNSLSYLQILGIDLLQLEIKNQLQPSQVSTLLKKSNDSQNQIRNSDEIILNNQRQFQPLHVQNHLTITQKWDEYLLNYQSAQPSTETKYNNTIRLKLQLGILKRYQRKPIISELVSNFGLTVNITSALLHDKLADGFFELEIWGKLDQIHSSLTYLEKLGLSLLIDATPESDAENLII
jgi:NIL domain